MLAAISPLTPKVSPDMLATIHRQTNSGLHFPSVREQYERAKPEKEFGIFMDFARKSQNGSLWQLAVILVRVNEQVLRDSFDFSGKMLEMAISRG